LAADCLINRKNNENMTKMERLARLIDEQVFTRYNRARHIREKLRWAEWLMAAVEELPGVEFHLQNKRVMIFTCRFRKFKLRFRHQIGGKLCRGGIEVVEVLQRKGNPDGRVLLRIASRDDAKAAYNGGLAAVIYRRATAQ
jgi:hypothetical protein